MNWKYLCGGALIAGALMVKFGAPLIPVVAGIVMAVAWNIWKSRTESL